MFRNHLASHRRIAQVITTNNLLPAASTAVDDTPEITALERTIVEAKEQHWDVYDVSEEERAGLRPEIARLAKTIGDGYRAEHKARTHR